MLGISSCDKAPINGKLDGRWQLMTIEYTNGKIEECNRIYYSIQLHLVEISAKGGNGGTHIGRFSYKGTFIKYYKISQLIHTQSIAN